MKFNDSLRIIFLLSRATYHLLYNCNLLCFLLKYVYVSGKRTRPNSKFVIHYVCYANLVKFVFEIMLSFQLASPMVFLFIILS